MLSNPAEYLKKELQIYKLKISELEVAIKDADILQDVLFKIVDLASETQALDGFYKELHRIISTLTQSRNFYIALYYPDINKVSFPYYHDDFDDEQNKDGPMYNPTKLIDVNDTFYNGPTWKVINSGELVHLDKKGQKGGGFGKSSENWLGVPLIYNAQLFGALVVQSYEPGFVYGKRDKKLLVYISKHIATVLRIKQGTEELKATHKKLQKINYELEDRVNGRTKELKQANQQLSKEVKERENSEKIQEALFRITDLVSISTNINDFFSGVYQNISKLMYAKNTLIAILSEDERELEFPYHVGYSQYQYENLDLSYEIEDKSLLFAIEVLKNKKPLIINKNQKNKSKLNDSGLTSWLGVPLIEKQKAFGVVVLESALPEHVHTKEIIVVLETIAKQISIAISRVKDTQTLKKSKDILEYDTRHDTLTKLPNRKYILEKLTQELENKSVDNKKLALLFLDLDGFKSINDSLGHHIGDLFLIEISKKLTSCMRHGDVVVRLGGDEFCILMQEINDEEMAIELAQRVLNKLREEVKVREHTLTTSGSIGIRVVIPGYDSATQVINDADSAMYHAKQKQKKESCFCLFDSKIESQVSKRLLLEKDLKQAVENKEIFLHYQPIVDLFNNEVIGFEALVRWQHLELGFIDPNEFIAISEETGIIQSLGEQVISMACQSLKELSKHEKTKSMYINVNISSLQILSRVLDEVIRKKVAEYDVSPSKLNIEITENVFIENQKAVNAFVKELKAIGMKVVLDGFGRSYSSLNCFHKDSLDMIKLNHSFIQSAEENESNLSLIELIGFLSDHLGIKMIIEGIETDKQLELAKALNCRYAQGFLIANPMSYEKINQFVQNYNNKASLET